MIHPSETVAAGSGPVPGAGQTASQNWLFAKLSAELLASFSDDQKRALHKAVSDAAAYPPVNIRLTIPLPGRRFYVTILSGQEKRSHDRRRHERTRHPVRTVANIFFILGFAVTFYLLALTALALFSTVVEI
ncbi:MAG: hypothetical protein WD407_06850 [Rhodospirillales bacterium]